MLLVLENSGFNDQRIFYIMSFFWQSRVGYNGIESWVSEFVKFNSQCIRKVLEKSSKSSKNKWYCPLCKTPVSKRYVIDS